MVRRSRQSHHFAYAVAAAAASPPPPPPAPPALAVNDYNSQEAVDNDDDSCYYETHHNFFPFSSRGLKSDFGGHDNHHHNNIYISGDSCMGVTPQKPGHTDAFYNNTCLLAASNPTYANFDTTGKYGKPAWPTMYENRVFTADGKAQESGYESIAAAQAAGHDIGSTVTVWPRDDEIVAMARALLGLRSAPASAPGAHS